LDYIRGNALFDERAQQEMWDKDPTPMHSSSYNPTGKAEKAAGGYKLSGRWSFSSGCDHCHGVMLGAICGIREVLGKPVPDFKSFLLLGDQYRIDDNWHVAGLQGTGSKDIVVENAFVPEYRSQSHIDYATNALLPG
jgi:3-hydroxy-9,10-secoandrosta-1,3,5(10)-triene-9,17-dione monooxygenase